MRPFYVLGPLVTDVFPGYDHITSANRRDRGGSSRRCDAVLRHPEGARRPAQGAGRHGRVHRLQDRGARR